MIRYKSGDPRGVPSGYSQQATPDDLTVPSCGLDDLERALFDVFDREIGFQVNATQKHPGGKVPVVFAGGEKWALMKKNRTLRDRTDSLILPIITIVRTSIEQNPADDICGRGMNQQTGETVIKRRLSPTDRGYQNLVNRIGVVNQLDVAVGTGEGVSGQLETSRDTRDTDMSWDYEVHRGGLMVPDRRHNIWEVISVPSPQFYTAKYDVTFWAAHIQHMNEMLEKFMSSLLVPGNCLKLESPKGYWFVAYPEGTSYAPDTNFSDQAGQERVIKCKFPLRVPGYLVASRAPGTPVPVRRFYSAPTISFTVAETSELDSGEEIDVEDPYIGVDDPTLPIDEGKSYRADRRRVPRSTFRRTDRVDGDDPALVKDSEGRPHRGRGNYVMRTVIDPKTRKAVKKLVRLVSTNAQGEEVFKDVDDFSSGLTVDVRGRM